MIPVYRPYFTPDTLRDSVPELETIANSLQGDPLKPHPYNVDDMTPGVQQTDLPQTATEAAQRRDPKRFKLLLTTVERLGKP